MKKYIPRLKDKYVQEIIPKLKESLGYDNVMQVPKLEKICINQGVGQAVNDKKLIEIANEEMTKISGQKPIVALSKKDISNFKLRKGMPIGVKVTLRREKMYEFLDRLISVSLPGVRDFQGIHSKGFDGRGGEGGRHDPHYDHHRCYGHGRPHHSRPRLFFSARGPDDKPCLIRGCLHRQ